VETDITAKVIMNGEPFKTGVCHVLDVTPTYNVSASDLVVQSEPDYHLIKN
jgi:hypothetical protein